MSRQRKTGLISVDLVLGVENRIYEQISRYILTDTLPRTVLWIGCKAESIRSMKSVSFATSNARPHTGTSLTLRLALIRA